MDSIKNIVLFSLVAFILLSFFPFLEYHIYNFYNNFDYSRISILIGGVVSGLAIAYLSKSIKNSLISIIIGGGISLVIISYLAMNNIFLKMLGILSEEVNLQAYILGRIIVLSLALLSTIALSYPLSLKKPKEEEKITKKIEEGVMVEKIQVREIPEEISGEEVEEKKEEIKEEVKAPTPEEKIESFLPKEEIKKEITKEILRTFPEFKDCPYCNSKIPFEAIFCPKCGKKVVS